MSFAIYSPQELPSSVVLNNQIDDYFELNTDVRYPPLIKGEDVTFLDVTPGDILNFKCKADTGVYFISSSGLWTSNPSRWASNVLDNDGASYLGNGAAYDNAGLYVQSDSTTYIDLQGQQQTVMGDYLTITFPNEENFNGYYLNGVGKRSVVCYFNKTLNKWVEFSTITTYRPSVPITVTVNSNIATSKSWRIITNTIHPPANNAAEIHGWWFYKKKPKLSFGTLRVSNIECENSNNNVLNTNVLNAGLVKSFNGSFSFGVSSVTSVSPITAGGTPYDFTLQQFNDGIYIVSLTSSNRTPDGPGVAELDSVASYCGILSVSATHTSFSLTQLQNVNPAGGTLTVALSGGNVIRVTASAGTVQSSYVFRLSALLIS
jgi:hypothetical protein